MTGNGKIRLVRVVADHRRLLDIRAVLQAEGRQARCPGRCWPRSDRVEPLADQPARVDEPVRGGTVLLVLLALQRLVGGRGRRRTDLDDEERRPGERLVEVELVLTDDHQVGFEDRRRRDLPVVGREDDLQLPGHAAVSNRQSRLIARWCRRRGAGVTSSCPSTSSQRKRSSGTAWRSSQVKTPSRASPANRDLSATAIRPRVRGSATPTQRSDGPAGVITGPAPLLPIPSLSPNSLPISPKLGESVPVASRLPIWDELGES